MPPAVIIAAFHPFSALPRIPVEMTGREYGLMCVLAELPPAGLLAIDGRLLRARRAVVAPPRSRSKAA